MCLSNATLEILNSYKLSGGLTIFEDSTYWSAWDVRCTSAFFNMFIPGWRMYISKRRRQIPAYGCTSSDAWCTSLLINGCTSDPGMKDVHLEMKDAHPCLRMYIFGCMMYIPGWRMYISKWRMHIPAHGCTSSDAWCTSL
jgi:hypothetical protein